MRGKTLKGFMFEAHRRIKIGDYVEQSKSLVRGKWVGLGTNAAYKSMIDEGLMTFFDGKIPPKRCMGWLVFTEKGAQKYNELLPELEVSYKKFEEWKKQSKNGYLYDYSLFGGFTDK